MQTSKKCTGCGAVKPLTGYYWTTRRNGEKARHSRCIECRRSQFSAWAKTSRGKQAKRAGILRREYLISDADYARMLAAQDARCAICRQPETKIHRDGGTCRLAVDHDHDTGKARALLCSMCNVGLGAFRDDPALLNAAATYVTAPFVMKPCQSPAGDASSDGVIVIASKPAPFHFQA